MARRRVAARVDMQLGIRGWRVGPDALSHGPTGHVQRRLQGCGTACSARGSGLSVGLCGWGSGGPHPRGSVGGQGARTARGAAAGQVVPRLDLRTFFAGALAR